MKGLVKCLGVLTVVIALVISVSSMVAAAVVIEDFGLAGFSKWVDLTHGGFGPASFTTDGDVATFELTLNTNITAGAGQYAYIVAWIYPGLSNFQNSSGMLIDVTSKDPEMNLYFGPAYSASTQNSEFIPWTRLNVSDPAGNPHMLVWIVVEVKGPAAVGTYSISFDSILAGEPLDLIRPDVDANTVAIASIDLSAVSANTAAINDILERLDALEAIVLDLPPGLLKQKDRNADSK